MTRLVTARYLVPIGSRPLENGALVIEQGRICAVGKLRELRAQVVGAQVVDYGDRVILPPLVNAHTHLELTGFPEWLAEGEGYLPDGDFTAWLLRVIAVKRSLDLDAHRQAILDGLEMCLRSGTGAIGDFLSVHSLADSYLLSPLLGRVYFEVLGQDEQAFSGVLGHISRKLRQQPGPHLWAGLAPHAPYTLNRKTLTLAADTVRLGGLAASIHVAESAAETELIRSAKGPLAERIYPLAGWQDYLGSGEGVSPVAFLDECGLLQPGVVLVHGVQVNGDDIERIRRRGCAMVLCPRSNERLGVGRAPAFDYIRAGVRVGLGTDSLASNDSLSLWDELAAAARIYPELAPEELLDMATRGGAEALGIGERIGSLAAGREAHFQVVQADTSTWSDSMVLESLTAGGDRVRVEQLVLHGSERLPGSSHPTYNPASIRECFGDD